MRLLRLRARGPLGLVIATAVMKRIVAGTAPGPLEGLLEEVRILLPQEAPADLKGSEEGVRGGELRAAKEVAVFSTVTSWLEDVAATRRSSESSGRTVALKASKIFGLLAEVARMNVRETLQTTADPMAALYLDGLSGALDSRIATLKQQLEDRRTSSITSSGDVEARLPRRSSHADELSFACQLVRDLRHAAQDLRFFHDPDLLGRAHTLFSLVSGLFSDDDKDIGRNHSCPDAVRSALESSPTADANKESAAAAPPPRITIEVGDRATSFSCSVSPSNSNSISIVLDAPDRVRALQTLVMQGRREDSRRSTSSPTRRRRVLSRSKQAADAYRNSGAVFSVIGQTVFAQPHHDLDRDSFSRTSSTRPQLVLHTPAGLGGDAIVQWFGKLLQNLCLHDAAEDPSSSASGSSWSSSSPVDKIVILFPRGDDGRDDQELVSRPQDPEAVEDSPEDHDEDADALFLSQQLEQKNRLSLGAAVSVEEKVVALLQQTELGARCGMQYAFQPLDPHTLMLSPHRNRRASPASTTWAALQKKFPPAQLYNSWIEVPKHGLLRNLFLLKAHVRKTVAAGNRELLLRRSHPTNRGGPHRTDSEVDQAMKEVPLFGAVLKINGYSSGTAQAAAAFRSDVDYYFVETPEEAIALRTTHQIHRTPVLLLYRTVMAPDLLCKLALLDIRVSALAVEWLLSLNLHRFCPAHFPALKFHAMLDTGLSREGMVEGPDDGLRLEEVVAHLARNFWPVEKGIVERKLQWEGLYTHWCCPYDPNAMAYSKQLFDTAVTTLQINNQVKFGKGEGEILLHASSSSTIFRFDTMYDMVRVGGLLFGANTAIDLVLQESVFWNMVEFELLGEQKGVVAEHASVDVSVTPPEREQPQTAVGAHDKYRSIQERLKLKYANKKEGEKHGSSTSEMMMKFEFDLQRPVEGQVHTDLFVLPSHRYFRLFDLEERVDDAAVKKGSGHQESASGTSASSSSSTSNEVPARFQHEAILQQVFDTSLGEKTKEAAGEDGGEKYSGVPLNALTWKTTVSHVARPPKSTTARLAASSGASSSSSSLLPARRRRYGPCMQSEQCLPYPTVDAEKVVLGSVPVGYDVFASDLALNCGSGRRDDIFGDGEDGGGGSSSSFKKKEMLRRLMGRGGSEEMSMSSVTEESAESASTSCRSYKFLYNTAVSGTFSTDTGPPPQEGDILYLCQHAHTCIPELLNIAPEVPRILV